MYMQKPLHVYKEENPNAILGKVCDSVSTNEWYCSEPKPIYFLA